MEKEKTTAAMGLAIRAAGREKKSFYNSVSKEWKKWRISIFR